MNSSDIIAIVAIVLSALVSVISTYISYQNNKANITARRSEMAFEKQLDAFREVVEMIGQIRRLALLARDKTEEKSFKAQLKKEEENLYSTYQKQRVYLPPHISEMIAEIGNYVASYINGKLKISVIEFQRNLKLKETEIVMHIHESVGFEKEYIRSSRFKESKVSEFYSE